MGKKLTEDQEVSALAENRCAWATCQAHYVSGRSACPNGPHLQGLADPLSALR
jgi:hypothetical protein